MDDLTNEKLAKIKKSLEDIINQDPTEVEEEREIERVILKEQKPKKCCSEQMNR